jgi:4-hydroxy-2-oxoheptanedioate aldolase
MADTPRLNGVIAALEQGKPAFVSFCAAEIGVAQAMNTASYDGVVFEMEHRPYDIRALRDCLQYKCWTAGRSCNAEHWLRR